MVEERSPTSETLANFLTSEFCSISPHNGSRLFRDTHKSGDLTSQCVLMLAVPWLVRALTPTPGTKANDMLGNERALIFML